MNNNLIVEPTNPPANRPRQIMQWSLALLLVALATISALYVARAQGRVCRDIDLVTVCADQEEDLSFGFDGRPVFIYDGNVTIARKGQAPYLKVVNSTQLVSTGVIHARDGNGVNDFTLSLYILGGLQVIGDPANAPLVSTIGHIEAACPATENANQLFGAFEINANTAKIKLLSPVEYAPIKTALCPFFTQKPMGFTLDFLNRFGLNGFFKDDKKAQNLAAATYEFDLTARKFNVVLPIELKDVEPLESANPIQINLRLTIDDKGKATGGVDGFKFQNTGTGLIWDVAGIVFTPKNGTIPAAFEAATVKVLTADNPSVPSFDPNDTTLVFEFSKLKYSDGNFSIGGAEVAIRDFTFGGAFKMTQNRLGFFAQTIDGKPVQSFQIRSKLVFNDAPDSVKPEVVVRIGATRVGGELKPVFQAGLGALTTEVGIFKANLTNAVFVGDAATNFWGIRAQAAALQWPPFAGGRTAAAITDFKLGIDNRKQLQFGLGSGTINLPEMENTLFKGSFGGTVATDQPKNQVIFTLRGNLGIKLPGNSGAGVAADLIVRHGQGVLSNDPTGARAAAQAAALRAASPNATCRNPVGLVVQCPGTNPTPVGQVRQFELKLTGFDIKVAGFKFAVQNPRALDDGGFAVEQATLALPVGLNFASSSTSGGITVQGFAIDGKGKVTLTGGAIELPPLGIGDLQFVGLKGGFIQLPNGSHEFSAGGKFPMPGLEPSAVSTGIAVEIKLRADLQTGDFTGAGATVFFQANPSKGLKIGSSGMELTGLGGTFDVNNGTVTIGVQMKASTLAFIPVINLPMVTAEGGAQAQFNPFKLSVNASIKLLIFQLAQAGVEIGHQAGFNGGDGVNFTASINGVLMNGAIEFRAGKITVNNTVTTGVITEAQITLGIKENTFGFLPRRDLTLASVTATGGLFNDKRPSPDRLAGGVKAVVEVIGIDFGVFLDFSQNGSGFLSFTNLDEIVRVGAPTLAAARATAQVQAASVIGAGITVTSEEGQTIQFTSRALHADEIAASGLVLSAAQLDGSAAVLQESFTRTVTETTKLALGIFYPAGAPQLSLRLPDGTVLNEGVNTATAKFKRTPYADGSADAVFVLTPATLGDYTVIIDNAPAGYEANLLYLDLKPQVNLTNVQCQGAPVAGVTVTCANVNGNPSSVKVDWHATDADTTGATVSVGYRVVTGTIAAAAVSELNRDAANANDFIPLANGLALGAGNFTWQFDQLQSGKYQVGVQVDDGVNVPVTTYTEQVITVLDQRAPAVPTGLAAIPQAGELLINWQQNTEQDLAGYMIGFGLVNDPNQFVYTRNMGPKEIITGTGNIVDAKLWGLDDNTTIFYGLRAYDISGNVSEWTPLQAAKPWALGPSAWTPTPNGQGQTTVEIAFAGALKPETVENALTVVDATGTVIPGEFYLLTDFESSTVNGIGFQPTTARSGAFTATLKGGAAGVQSTDGRTMGGDYVWTFRLTGNQLFLPLVSR